MPLFLIEHRHTEESCPTHNPDMVRGLRAHVTPENAERLGVKLLADWVNEPDHHVVIVVESPTLAAAEGFGAPFAQNGSVEVTMGLTCDQVAKECLGE
ncbi:MAG: sulfite oxidase [Dehalococcoidia bacterium]|nr:sulfite oxidase [Dehalococcoidia bacterium]